MSPRKAFMSRVLPASLVVAANTSQPQDLGRPDRARAAVVPDFPAKASLATAHAAPHNADTLSSLLEAVRVRRTLWGILQITEHSGLWASPVYDVRFLMMVEGSAYIESENQTILASKGDYVLMTQGSTFSMRDSRRSRTTCVTDASKSDRSQGPVHVKIGDGDPRAIVVCLNNAVDLPTWKPVAKFLPTMIHIKSPDGNLPFWAGPIGDMSAVRLAGIGRGAETLLCRFGEICIIQSIRAHIDEQYAGGELTRGELLPEPRIFSALRLINANPGQAWSVTRLAKSVAMSRSAFAEAFRAHVGQPPMQYVTNIRMNRALDLLRHKNIPLGEIAQQIGYGSEEAFARTFKRQFKIMPKAYRASACIESAGAPQVRDCMVPSSRRERN